jgi:hypothetical protein
MLVEILIYNLTHLKSILMTTCSILSALMGSLSFHQTLMVSTLKKDLTANIKDFYKS